MTSSRELNEDEEARVSLEVWATRNLGSDWQMGRLVFFPAMRKDELSEHWEELLSPSSSQKMQQEITIAMLKRAHRMAKRAAERTPELLMQKRLEIRKKKALTIQAQREAIIAAGWGAALEPVQVIKRRRIPASLSKYIPLITFLGFVFALIILAFLPGEILTLMGL